MKAAQELVRFTCQQTRHVNRKVDNVHSTLRHLAKRSGNQQKRARLFWVEPSEMSEKERQLIANG